MCSVLTSWVVAPDQQTTKRVTLRGIGVPSTMTHVLNPTRDELSDEEIFRLAHLEICPSSLLEVELLTPAVPPARSLNEPIPPPLSNQTAAPATTTATEAPDQPSARKKRKIKSGPNHLSGYPLFAWAIDKGFLVTEPASASGEAHPQPFPMEIAAFILKLVIDQSSSASTNSTSEGAGDEHQLQTEGR